MLLRVENIEKTYGRRKVVIGLSFDIEPAEVVGLLGRNGAGKTTSFKIVAGIVHADGGKVFLNGKDVTRLPIYKRARNGLGYLSQEPSVFQGLTVEENLLSILETVADKRHLRKKIAHGLLEEYGLLKVARQKACTLSGGEMRRLEICRAMITDPSLIMLDEPFSGVDPIAVSEIQQYIKVLKEKGIGVLLTDHNVRETLSITDRSYIIDEGRLMAQGRLEDIVNNPIVRQKYLGEDFRM